MPFGLGTPPLRCRFGEMTEAVLVLAAVVGVHVLALTRLPGPLAPARSSLPIVVDLLSPAPAVQPLLQPPRIEAKPQPPRVAPIAGKPTQQASRPPVVARTQAKSVTVPAVAAPSAIPSAPAAAIRSAAAEPSDASRSNAATTPFASVTSKPSEFAALADNRASPPQPLVPPRFDAPHLRNPSADYPRLARRLGEQGQVMLRVFVNRVGAAEKVEIESSSGSPRLDRAALDAVARWKFVPARRGDVDVGAWLRVPVVFRLDG